MPTPAWPAGRETEARASGISRAVKTARAPWLARLTLGWTTLGWSSAALTGRLALVYA